MEIYVQSCGSKVDQDYSWRKVDNDGSGEIETPNSIEWINKFIQKDAPSIFIGRKAERLILFISNLESIDRVDYMGRKARNSLLWIANGSEEEMLVRGVAARVLKESDAFAADIDRIVAFSDDRYGFVIDNLELHQLLTKPTATLGDLATIVKGKIGKNSPTLKNDLADELLRHRLPAKDGVLVVVTQYQDPKVFIKAKVWRGLSSLIAADNWQNIANNTRLYIGLAVGSIVGLLALSLWIWLKFFNSSIKQGNYLTIVKNGSNSIKLYDGSDLKKENIKAVPNTIFKVIEKQNKWIKVEICKLPDPVIKARENIKRDRLTSRRLKSNVVNNLNTPQISASQIGQKPIVDKLVKIQANNSSKPHPQISPKWINLDDLMRDEQNKPYQISSDRRNDCIESSRQLTN